MPIEHEQPIRDWLAQIAEFSGAFSLADGEERRIVAGGAWDLDLAVRPGGGGDAIRLLVAEKRQLQPRHIRELAHRIGAADTDTGARVIVSVAAPYISARTAELCREHGIGYLDAAGNCHLAGHGLCVHIEGRANAAPDTRGAENLFASKSSRVVRVLLEHPARAWRVADLAAESGVSLGLVSRIRRGLIEQAYAESVPGGVRLRDPAGLLGAWSRVYARPARAVQVFSADRPERLEASVVAWARRRGVRCGLAEFAGAARLAPMVRYQRSAVYIEEERGGEVLRDLLAELDMTEVETGATATLWITRDDSVFYRCVERGGLPVVSPVQLYLDLVQNPARGEEAAAEIARGHLPFAWPARAGGAGA